MTNLYLSIQALLPQHGLSRLVGKLADLQRPRFIKNALIKLFMRGYDIRLDEALVTTPTQFPTFNAFFTRALKDGARPLGDATFVQPADGVVSQLGAFEAGTLVQAKGRTYSVKSLLGGDGEERLERGSFATVYLSPRDYHRVHMPISGRLIKARYVPGDLFAVNLTTAEGIEGLYARNERLVCWFDTAEGSSQWYS